MGISITYTVGQYVNIQLPNYPGDYKILGFKGKNAIVAKKSQPDHRISVPLSMVKPNNMNNIHYNKF